MPTWFEPARIIDVSHWQVPLDLDWVVAEAAGVVGIIIKATQGIGGEDPAFFEHSINAYRDNMPLLGAYHFGDGSDGALQAKHFLARVRRAYGDDLSGLMLMLDAERNKPQMTIAIAEDFVAAIHDSEHRWPWFYTGKDGPTGDGEGLPNDMLSNCPLLLAKYGPEPTLANLPKGWRFPINAQDRGEMGMGVVRGWQFTDGTIHGGPFSGLGRVDESKLCGVSTLTEARTIWAT